jgi:hypothetical protein
MGGNRKIATEILQTTKTLMKLRPETLYKLKPYTGAID